MFGDNIVGPDSNNELYGKSLYFQFSLQRSRSDMIKTTLCGLAQRLQWVTFMTGKPSLQVHILCSRGGKVSYEHIKVQRSTTAKPRKS